MTCPICSSVVYLAVGADRCPECGSQIVETKKPWLTQKEVAERLQCSTKKLQLLRREGKPPKAVKLGHRTVRYADEEIERYLAKETEC